MGKRRTSDLIEGILGQHINLIAAVHVARTQLLRNPEARYDAQRILETLDIVARAMVKVATLYVRESDGEPRELTPAELESGTIVQCGRYLILKDGRRLSNLTIKRAELRQAIVVLRAVGIPELGHAPKEAAPAAPRPSLRAQMAELEQLLGSPLTSPRLERANAILISMARDGRDAGVAQLAMQLMSELPKSRDAGQLDERVAQLLAQLMERSNA